MNIVRLLAVLSFVIAFGVNRAVCDAQATPTPTLAPETAATPTPQPSNAPAVQSSPEPLYFQPGPLYNEGPDIYSIDRSTTLFYYFQGNANGSAKSKQEFRYYRNLPQWDKKAQIGIRIPFITQYPVFGNPYAGLANMELRYLYPVKSDTFDHSLEFGVMLPTNANNVDSKDTELKAFYTTKWKWKGGGVTYANEYDQTIFTPANTPWTSYYEGKLTFPDYPFVNVLQGISFSAIYNYRFIFSSGGVYKDVIGGMLFGNLGAVAISITDTFGWHQNTLWKFRLEANATARF